MNGLIPIQRKLSAPRNQRDCHSFGFRNARCLLATVFFRRGAQHRHDGSLVSLSGCWNRHMPRMFRLLRSLRMQLACARLCPGYGDAVPYQYWPIAASVLITSATSLYVVPRLQSPGWLPPPTSGATELPRDQCRDQSDISQRATDCSADNRDHLALLSEIFTVVGTEASC